MTTVAPTASAHAHKLTPWQIHANEALDWIFSRFPSEIREMVIARYGEMMHHYIVAKYFTSDTHSGALPITPAVSDAHADTQAMQPSPVDVSETPVMSNTDGQSTVTETTPVIVNSGDVTVQPPIVNPQSPSELTINHPTPETLRTLFSGRHEFVDRGKRTMFIRGFKGYLIMHIGKQSKTYLQIGNPEVVHGAMSFVMVHHRSVNSVRVKCTYTVSLSSSNDNDGTTTIVVTDKESNLSQLTIATSVRALWEDKTELRNICEQISKQIVA